MFKRTKVVWISLICIALLIGGMVSGVYFIGKKDKDTSNSLSNGTNGNISSGKEVHVYQPGEVKIQSGDDVVVSSSSNQKTYKIDFTYLPGDEEEPTTIAYEYAFNGIGESVSAVNLKSINISNCTVRYTYNDEPLNIDKEINAEDTYTIQEIENKLVTKYLYILITPNDTTSVTNFTQDITWFVGKTKDLVIKNTLNKNTSTIKIIEGQDYDEGILTVPNVNLDNGYYFDAWYLDEKCINLPNSSSKFGDVVCARYANAPLTYIQWETEQNAIINGCYTVNLPGEEFNGLTHLVIPSMYNGQPVTGVDLFGCYEESIDLPSTIIELGLEEQYNLVDVDLSKCVNLERLIRTFFDCYNLTSLDFSNCPKFTLPDWSEFSTTPTFSAGQLSYINLSKTAITTIPEKTFAYSGENLKIDLIDCKNLETIENGAFAGSNAPIVDFSGCENLEDISGMFIKGENCWSEYDNIPTFEKINLTNCTSLDINSNTFVGAEVKSVDLTGTNITTIPENTFKGIATLTEIVLPSGLQVIGSNAFNGAKLKTITIPSSVTSIGDYAFYNCDATTLNMQGCEVEFYNNEYVFSGNNLTEITVSENSKYSIDGNGFLVIKSNNNPTDIVLGLNVANFEMPAINYEIYPYAFAGCENLRVLDFSKLQFASGIIGKGAFAECCNLNTIINSEWGISIDVDDYAFYKCVKLTSVECGYVGEHAFEGCTSLERVTGLSTVEAYAFNGCKNLVSVSGPRGYNESNLNEEIDLGLNEIGDYAFKDCILLTSLTINKTATQIGKLACTGCTNLSEVVFRDTSNWYKVSGSYEETEIDVTNSAQNVEVLKSAYYLKKY